MHTGANGHDVLFRRPMVGAAEYVAGQQGNHAVAVLYAVNQRVKAFAVQHVIDARHQPHGGKRLQVVAQIIRHGMPYHTVAYHSHASIA